MEQTIGEVARRTGVTERTLRYYEELGLLTPRRDSAGRRRYDVEHVDRLYRVRLMRELGTPLAEVDPDGTDLLALTTGHLAELDRRVAELSRQRERVRTVEERLMGGATPTDAELVGVLAGLPDTEPSATRRLALLVYRDIEAAHRHLVEVLGFAAGDLTRDDDDKVVHGEVFAGDGVIWMHRESEEFRLASPATLGAATQCMAVHVEDVDRHYERVRDAGGEIVYEPTDMPYGVREYAVRDNEGGLWSFMQPLRQPEGTAP
jgi:MerR family transcriptional regulator, thiopeptide resistance regulator